MTERDRTGAQRGFWDWMWSGVLLVALLVSAGYSTLNWSSDYAALNYPDMRASAMLEGTARKPFVNRTLVPSLFKSLAQPGELVVQPLHAVLVSFDDTRAIIMGLERAQGFGSPRQASLFVGLVWLSLFCLGLGVWSFLRACGLQSSRVWIVASLAVLLWPLLKNEQRNMYFMYDPFTPTLVLWTLVALFRRYYFASFVGFVACALNRETAVLLPAVFAYACAPGQGLRGKLFRFRQDLRKNRLRPWVRILSAGAVALGAVLYLRHWLLQRVYVDAFGRGLELHFVDSTLYFAYALDYVPRVAVVWTLFYLIAVRRWSRLNALMQGATLMFGVQLVLSLIVGVVGEIRQYGELWGAAAVVAGFALLSPNRAMPERPATPPAKAMRWLVAGIVAPALAWMLAASVSHWRDSSSGAALGEQLKLRPDHLLAQRRPVGRPWNDAGNYVFTGHRPVSFFVEPPRRAEKVDIGLDGDDQYRIMLKSDHGSTEHLVNPEFQWGIRSHVLEAPPGELEQIRVVPIQGDGHFAVGHVVLRSTGR